MDVNHLFNEIEYSLIDVTKYKERCNQQLLNHRCRERIKVYIMQNYYKISIYFITRTNSSFIGHELAGYWVDKRSIIRELAKATGEIIEGKYNDEN